VNFPVSTLTYSGASKVFQAEEEIRITFFTQYADWSAEFYTET
jgi:hypothetical protein